MQKYCFTMKIVKHVLIYKTYVVLTHYEVFQQGIFIDNCYKFLIFLSIAPYFSTVCISKLSQSTIMSKFVCGIFYDPGVVTSIALLVNIKEAHK